MLTVSDLNRVLADCGDGLEVKADGNTLLAAQVEGTDPRFLNLVSQPAGVRLPEGTTPAADAGTPEPAPNPGTAEPEPAPTPAGDDQDGSADLV